MKVMQIQDEWGADNIRLAERPDPRPGPGQIVVRMRAASLNYRDTVMVNRGYGRRSGELPLVPVSDGAGEVVALGPRVTRVKEGDLVCPIFSRGWLAGTFTEAQWSGTLGGPRDGTMQEMMLLDAEDVVRAPRHMSAAEAATLPCAAVTAWNALVEQGGVKAGDVVVIQGTGGVSLFGLQIAKMHGAEVVLTSSSDEKLARGQEMGADHVVNYTSTPDWGKAVREVTDGRGADHIVEVGGAGTLEQSIRAIRPSGVISLIGVLSGGAGEINLGAVVTQNVRLQGITVGSRQMFENMVRAMEYFETRPAIDADRGFAFDELAQALKDFPKGGHFGKVVCEF